MNSGFGGAHGKDFSYFDTDRRLSSRQVAVQLAIGLLAGAGWLVRRIQITLLAAVFKHKGVVPEARRLQGIILSAGMARQFPSKFPARRARLVAFLRA
jgi:hypothetical protein